MATAGGEPGAPPTRIEVVADIAPIIERARRGDLVAVGVDMPIGLPTESARRADREARTLLGARRSSLFPTPAHAVLAATDYGDALARSRAATGVGLSKQAYNLVPRIRQLRAALDPSITPRVAEVHPETSFAVLAGRPCSWPKSTASGALERLGLLERAGLSPVGLAVGDLTGCGLDDVLDALVASWTAQRIAREQARWFGDPAERDPDGFPLTIAA